MTNIYDRLLDYVKQNQTIGVDLKFSYKVVFNALHGNFPVNSGISGSLLNIPVDLRFSYHIVTNTKGNFPVNSWLKGYIGDEFINARMNYTTLYNTIAGNMPINTGITFEVNGENHTLRMPTRWAIAPARGSGMGGGKKKGYRIVQKVLKGQIQEIEETGEGDGGPSQNTGRPLPAGIYGTIGELKFDIDFSYTYFTNTITGRNPVNNHARGLICLAA